MESFYNLLCVFGITSVVDDVLDSGKVDMLSRLPPEIATTILRLLPDKDLANAAAVSTKWFKVCRCDRVISKRIHCHLKLCKKSKMKSLLRSVRHTLRRSEQGKPFSVFYCLQLSKPQLAGNLENNRQIHRAFDNKKYEDLGGQRKQLNARNRTQQDGRLSNLRF